MNKPYVSAEDIRRLFYDNKPTQRFPWWQFAAGVVLVSFGIFAFFNAPAVTKQLNYWWQNDIQAARPIVSPAAQIPVVGSTVAPTVVTQKPITQKTVVNPATLADNTLWIPRTSIKAPIIWDVTGGGDLNTDLLEALRSGVVRYPQTALPNQVGNVFLTGHSSNYWWEKGSYKTIFALLDKLVAGDDIFIKYQGIVYHYRVTGQRVVKPADTSVLAATKTPTLSLMTCTPTGTSLKRRIVTAKLIEPTQNLVVQPVTTGTANSTLEVVR